MNLESAIILPAIFAGLGVMIWGLFSTRRSATIGVIAAVVAAAAAVGSWYAWAETRSIPWTVGYGVIVIASLASAARQFSGGPAPK